MKILVISTLKNNELKATTKELIFKAKSLGANTAALAIGHRIESLSVPLSELGSDMQMLADHPNLHIFSAINHGRAILQAINDFSPDQVWLSLGEAARAIAPYLAANLNCGVAIDAIDIEMIGNQITAIRFSHASKILQKVRLYGKPQIIVFRNGIFTPDKDFPGKHQPKQMEIRDFDTKIDVKELISSVQDTIDLTEAKIVVGVGRGCESQQGIDFAINFAKDIGAAYGASRAVVDSNWLPYNLQIGQTGKIVSPTLYIALGISGAVQHLAGIGGAKTILAVNIDPDAPIFNFADYGIVGDLFRVTPILKNEILSIHKA